MTIFKKIRYKNFFSVGNNFIEIDFQRNPTTIIFGKNGSGKSIFVEALSFVLFGKPYRNTNKPSLLNSINDKDCLVEVEFEIGKNKYLVRRGIKPNIFEIYKNKKLVNQEAKSKDYQKYLEEDILKFTWKVFRQIIVLGSATYTPFMQLTAADRRFVIENLLDIQIFSSMNVLLKQQVSDNKEQELLVNNKLILIEEKIKLQQKYLDELKKDVNLRIQTLKKQTNDTIEKKKKYIEDVIQLRNKINELETGSTDLPTRIMKANSLLSQFESKLVKMNSEIDFFKETSNCPTCRQNITENHKCQMVDSKKQKIDETIKAKGELEEKLSNLNKDLEVYQNKQTEVTRLQKNITKIQSQILACDNLQTNYQNEISTLENQTDDTGEKTKELKVFEKDKKKYTKELNEYQNKKHYFDILSIMLKDSGIKTNIIRQYLPIINKQINKYLADMNFFVDFKLDENFKECIKSRGVDEFTYESFSEGEKLRMDLSILMTWREITKLKNSVNTNLIVADEIFEKALDQEGIDDLVRIMKSVWKNYNVFILSPRGETMLDKFDEYIKFEKINGFTRMIDE